MIDPAMSARIELSFGVSEDLSGERPNRRSAQVVQDLFGNGCSCAHTDHPKPGHSVCANEQSRPTWLSLPPILQWDSLELEVHNYNG